MLDDLYCKIYVNTSLSKEELLQHIANFTGGNVFVRTVETDLMGIDVILNEDRDSKLSHKNGGFIHYPYYLEIDPTNVGEENPKIYIYAISKLLKFLWTMYKDAIPACDYEAQLSATTQMI